MPEAIELFRERFQEARAELFCRLLAPRPGLRILDLGGNRGQLSRRIMERVSVDVTVADILDLADVFVEGGIEFVLLSPEAHLPFEAAEFDIVLCNSVIEHVTLPKPACRRRDISNRDWLSRARAAQRAFAAEIRRVGRGYFVQTPHVSFPLDLHLGLPFSHWLPHRAGLELTRVTDRFWIRKSGDFDWQLVPPRLMREFFPEASLHVERWLGLPKSLVAYKRAR